MPSTTAPPAVSLPHSHSNEVIPPESDLPRYWRPAVLAKHLGLSRQSIYSLMRCGDLEAVHFEFPVRPGTEGKRKSEGPPTVMRVSDSSVRAYLARCQERHGKGRR